jgi:hypothetical protein
LGKLFAHKLRLLPVSWRVKTVARLRKLLDVQQGKLLRKRELKAYAPLGQKVVQPPNLNSSND